MAEELFPLLEPVLADSSLELIDVELRSGVVLVTVDREGGVDLEALTQANRVVSSILDEHDPFPGHYTLEVSSPGVERTLRTPAHFARAIGEKVTVKTRPQVPGDRRLTGTLMASDDDGLVLRVEGDPTEDRRLGYSDIDRARTVFEWGPAPRPTGAAKKAEKAATAATAAKAKNSPKNKAAGSTQKRKQVTTP
ncbi:MAG TPA: ribosome maturation factor RimP [Acidimicrobiales bacterium]|jgi:ribosome maturation factor RimP|nr:ribosome maturation factor RimP [Acidimicrobiales bacterium]